MTITLEQMKEIISLCERLNIPYEYNAMYSFGEEKVCGHTLEILATFDTNDIDEEDKRYNEN